MKRKAVIKNIDPQFLHKSVQKTVGEIAELTPRTIYVSAGALINLQNEVLICTRPEGKDYAGMWEFPGGKIEQNEQPERALSRELNEELGVEVSVKDMTAFSFASHVNEESGAHILMYLYLVKTWHGNVVGKEGQKCAWVPLTRLTEYIDIMPPIDRPLAEMLVRYTNE